MAIFKSNPEKTIQRDIDAATANRDRLSTKLAECDQAIARHASAAKDSALSGDDAGLDAAEASLRAAQDRAATLKRALTEMNQRLADLERAKEDAADKKLRAETAAEIDRLIGKLTEVGTEFNQTAVRLSEHTARAVPLVYDALGPWPRPFHGNLSRGSAGRSGVGCQAASCSRGRRDRWHGACDPAARR